MDGSTRRKEETVEKATKKETASLTVMNGQLPEKNGWIPKGIGVYCSPHILQPFLDTLCIVT